MKIGMNMLLWTNNVTEAHLPIIREIKETGFDGVEIPLVSGSLSWYFKLGKFIKDLELIPSAVASLHAAQNIASPDKATRQAGLDHLKWAIDVGQALGINMLTGPMHSAYAYFTRKPATEDEKKWSIDCLQRAGHYADKAGITLGLEALNRWECYLINTMAEMKPFVESINLPNVGILYDTHHGNIEEKNQKEALLSVAPYIKHIHIAENDRGTPGKGQVHWDDVFSALKEMNYQGEIVIESFSRELPSFADAINVWRNYSPLKQVYQDGFEFLKNEVA